MQGDSITSPTLLGRLRMHPKDQSAWSDFVDRYGRKIEGWLRGWGLQPSDAEDVAQNVMLQLSRQMSRFEYDAGGSFCAWLKTVAYRAWCDYLSQQRRRGESASGSSTILQMLGSVEARESFLEQIQDEWNREMLEEAMRLVRLRVKDHTWEVFRLMTRENMSGPQVAEHLKMKVGAVWVAKSKVQKMIYEEIQRLDKFDNLQGAT